HRIHDVDQREGAESIERLEPHVPRKDVERRFNELRKVPFRNTARRFKFQTLVQRYSTMQAKDLMAAGRTPSRLRIIAEFPISFLKAYVGRRYALRGVYGYLVSLNYAYYRSLRLAKAYEMSRAGDVRKA
nr:hypothetical protein [Hyphomonas sp.]